MKSLTIGQRFYDWQVSANIIVLEPNFNSYPDFTKCMVENSGAEYVARVDALEEVRVYDIGSELIEVAITYEVGYLAAHEFYDAKLLEMIDSAPRGSEHGISPITAYLDHPLWSINKEYVVKGDKHFKLKYLLVHGFTSECLFSQAGVV
jgi:hypothetical protein